MSNAKWINCDKVSGFAGGKNTRDAWGWMREIGAVMFRSELTGEDDQRKVVMEMMYGKDADDKSRKEVLGWVKKYDSAGPESQWALAVGFLSIPQQEAGVVVPADQGLLLVSGARRHFANGLAHLMMSDHEPKFLAIVSDEQDVEKQQDLGVLLNTTHKKITPVEEGRRYFELKESLGLSDKEIAARLNVYDSGGKLNVQRVGQLRKLWDGRVTDEDRAKIEAGTSTVEKVIAARVRKGGSGGDTEKKTKRDRCMKFTDLVAIYNDLEQVSALMDGVDLLTPEECVRFGMAIALFGDDKVSEKYHPKKASIRQAEESGKSQTNPEPTPDLTVTPPAGETPPAEATVPASAPAA